jgi:hypothetical protein
MLWQCDAAPRAVAVLSSAAIADARHTTRTSPTPACFESQLELLLLLSIAPTRNLLLPRCGCCWPVPIEQPIEHRATAASAVCASACGTVPVHALLHWTPSLLLPFIALARNLLLLLLLLLLGVRAWWGACMGPKRHAHHLRREQEAQDAEHRASGDEAGHEAGVRAALVARPAQAGVV